MSAKLSLRWQPDLGRDGKAGVPAVLRGMKRSEIGRIEPIHQESTWKEIEENMTGLEIKLEGKSFDVLSLGELTTDEQ